MNGSLYTSVSSGAGEGSRTPLLRFTRTADGVSRSIQQALIVLKFSVPCIEVAARCLALHRLARQMITPSIICSPSSLLQGADQRHYTTDGHTPRL